MRLNLALQCMKVYIHAGLGCEHVLLTGRQKEKNKTKKHPQKTTAKLPKYSFLK